MAGHGGDGRHGTLVHGSRGCPPETRGIAVRSDQPTTDPALAHRLLVGGLDKVWTKAATPAARRLEPAL
jgi:hypothetical protein